MKFFAGLAFLFSVETHAQFLDLSYIYGQDNRIEFSSASSQEKNLADSTAALIVNSFLVKRGSRYKVDAPTLDQIDGLCPSEKFRDEPAASICSGTLIAEDLILTASHCYAGGEICKNASWAFGYHDNKNGKYEIKAKDLYRCKEIVFNAFDLSKGQDFAIVKLDRKVKNHRPVELRPSGSPELNTKLILIGHPRGLPTKIAGDAWVTSVNEFFFMANLDAYSGNSGSGVFNAETLLLEGVLSYGKDDYVDDQAHACQNSAVYDMQDGGEAVMKIDPVREFLRNYSPPRR